MQKGGGHIANQQKWAQKQKSNGLGSGHGLNHGLNRFVGLYKALNRFWFIFYPYFSLLMEARERESATDSVGTKCV
jgi:hypothetical protein